LIFEHLQKLVEISDWFHEYWKALGEDRCEYCTKEITKRQKHFRIKFPDVSIQWHEKCARKWRQKNPPLMRTPLLFKKGDNIKI
jgi:hypothetical protein